jgi:Ca-activated chloride channel homolog
VRPNRLARAKLAALDLIKKAKNDRLGLVAFAGDAFLQCPLTLDEEAFRQSVEALEVGIIPQGGTALTTAIETALTAFKTEGDNHKVLVLMTDGEDHESGAIEAAKKAAGEGLRIFTLGVGTPGGELLRIVDDKGVATYVKDAQGTAVKSRLNEGLLQQIATDTGGFYLPLRAAGVIETLYEKGLAPLPKSENTSRLIRRYHERFQWPLAFAIGLLLLETLLPEQKRASRGAGATVPGAGLPRLAALFLLLAFGVSTRASPGKALQQYQAGNYPAAEKEYRKLLETRPTDSRLHYNAGAAAYQNKQYDQAVQSFSQALTSSDLNLQQKAFYNLGDSLYRLGEQTEEVNAKLEKWESAVKQFKGALTLNPQDADAKHNLEFVTKKIEELKQQQSKQQKPDQNNKDQDKQQKQEGKDQQKGDQQQKDQQSPESKDKSQEKQKQDQTKSGDGSQDQKPDQSDQNKQDRSAKDQQKSQQQAANQKPDSGSGKSEEGQEGQGQAGAAMTGQMTVQQAEQLLNSQKGEEKAMIFLQPQKSNPKDRVFKDW